MFYSVFNVKLAQGYGKMNVTTLWQYTHQALRGALDGQGWDRQISPKWTLRDAIINLTAMEYVLYEVLDSLMGEGATPTLDRFVADYDCFNREEVAERCNRSGDEILDEYRYAYAQTSMLMSRIPSAKWYERGTLPWYGSDFSLEDFVVFFLFGHKRKIVAQIMASH